MNIRTANILKTENLPCLGRYSAGGDLEKERESEFFAFIDVTANKYIGRRCKSLPLEDRKEIKSKIYEYFVENFDRISSNDNWAGYVERCCSGMVKNYKRDNKKRWHELVDTLEDDETPESKMDRLSVNINHKQGAELIDINWDLLSRLCYVDKELHAFVKVKLLGYSLKDVEYHFGVSDQKRVWDLIEAFLSRFKMQSSFRNPWFLQICFALGICELLDIDSVDQRQGYNFEKVDLLENRSPPEQIFFDFQDGNETKPVKKSKKALERTI